jgi:hypothetical protein
MESGTTTFREEETSIIGVFGQEVRDFSNMLMQLALLIVNLELKHYLYGKLSAKQSMQLTDPIILRFYYLTKDMEVDSALLQAI